MASDRPASEPLLKDEMWEMLVTLLLSRLEVALERERTMFAGIPVRATDQAAQTLLGFLREAPGCASQDAMAMALRERVRRWFDEAGEA